jgi:hypothetical protein
MDALAVDLTFDHDYAVELCTDLPGGPEQRAVLYFPGAGVGAYGVIVTIEPHEGGAWTGMFAFGQLSSRGISGVFACPGGQILCVVSRGAGLSDPCEQPIQMAEDLVGPDFRC